MMLLLLWMQSIHKIRRPSLGFDCPKSRNKNSEDASGKPQTREQVLKNRVEPKTRNEGGGEKFTVIVDAYSTGAKLAKEFEKYGIQSIHVKSSPNIPDELIASFRPGDFQIEFDIDEGRELNEVFEELRRIETIICVVAGTETGVEAAERLALLLGLPGNDPATTSLRRDKFEMHERLRSFGLSSLGQSRCESREAALAWAIQQTNWPIVVKPTSSAGADGVTFCNNLSEVVSATDAALGKRNKLGTLNAAVVLQERISGQQFIVNAVSVKGVHYISEIWRDDKIPVKGASLICDREILMRPDTPLAKSLRDYVIRCLDALGIKDGPSHSELFQTEQDEFVLIETAARMQGTIDHEAVIEATGHSHVTLTALRYADPITFAQLLDEPYGHKRNLHCITLCSKHSGVVKENRCPEYLGRLESFRSLIGAPRQGDFISRTVDLFTNTGIVYLSNHNEEILEREYRLIRHWESAGDLLVLHQQL